MKNAKTLLKRLWNEEDGVTIIEYSLLAALIAVVAVATITTVGTRVNATFDTVKTKLGG